MNQYSQYTQQPSDDTITELPDLSFQIYCEQISANYLDFIKREIMSRLDDFSNHGIRELRVLVCIHNTKGNITSARVAELLMFDPATVSRATKRLIKDGYVVVSPDPLDTRMVRLTASERGEAVGQQYMTLTNTALSHLNHMFSQGLNEVEKKAFLGALKKLSQRANNVANTKLDDSIFQTSGLPEKA